MRMGFRSMLTSILFCEVALCSPFPDEVGDFALLDQNGKFHQLSEYGEKKAAVFLAIDKQCQKNTKHLTQYSKLRSAFQAEEIVFFAIDSTGKEIHAGGSFNDATHGTQLSILIDDSQLIAESLGIKSAGEVVVIEPETGVVFYRGGMGFEASQPMDKKTVDAKKSTPAFFDTLRDISSGEIDRGLAPIERETLGCDLDFTYLVEQSDNLPDYATDVAPLLVQKCVTCHFRGGIAPFAMDSHEMVKGWSSMIKEVLLTKRMPPAQVDPSINHFSNARYMESSELQTLIGWINGGSPRGESLEDPLEYIQPIESLWQLGEPDYIVELPTYKVPATGILDYENVSIELPFTKDVWIKSVQFIPGDRRVLHHLMSYIAPAASIEQIAVGVNDDAWSFLEGYAPGKEDAAIYPKDTGVFVPTGSAIHMSLHYTTFGQEAVDQTRIGLYFNDEEPRFEYLTYALSHGGSNILIPPNAKEHLNSASHIFEDEILLHGLRPHMHYRGKYMRMIVEYPNGSTEDIINVPNYNFAWQPTYRLTKPMVLPAGSRVTIEGAFDNSRYNLGNPDPDSWVRGGAQSWNEMFIGYFSYHKVLH